MTKALKIFAVVAVIGGILALTLGGIALAAETDASVCDGTGTKARLHAQDGTCDEECTGDPLGTMTQQRIRLQTAECDGTCEDPLKTQMQTREQLKIQDGTCLEEGTEPLKTQTLYVTSSSLKMAAAG